MDVVALQAAKANAARLYGRKLRGLGQRHNYAVNPVMSSPPTIGTLATATAIATPRFWDVITTSGSTFALAGNHFTFSCAGAPVRHGSIAPDYKYIRFTSLSNGSLPFAPFACDFYHDGSNFELMFKQITGVWRLWVDGQLVQAGTVAVPNNATEGYQPITFGSRALRHIRFEGGGPFRGVVTPVGDTIHRAQVYGPRVICIGDSYTEGANTTDGAAGHWVRHLGEIMGWPDTWSSGVGGTGYLNPGSSPRTKFRDRLANDVYPYKPDLIIWMGGHNDISGYLASDLQVEALACFEAVQANIPGCVQVALGPVMSGGITGNGLVPVIAARDAIKTAAATAGISFIDPNEMPLGATAIVTTSTSSVAAGSSTAINLNTVIPVGSTIDLEGTERVLVTAVSGVGPYTHTLSSKVALAHNSGITVKQVGPAWLTGTGSGVTRTVADGVLNSTTTVTSATAAFATTDVGSAITGTGIPANTTIASRTNATTIVLSQAATATATGVSITITATKGDGNSDYYIGNDGIHPTAAGQKALGHWVAAMLTKYVLPSV